MHIITVPTSFAATVYILFAFCIQEICDRGKLSLNLFPVEKSSISIFLSILSILLLTILDINVPYNMISQVINHNHILNFTILHHLSKNLFKEIFIFSHCCICILSTHIVSINQCCLNRVVFIHVF